MQTGRYNCKILDKSAIVTDQSEKSPHLIRVSWYSLFLDGTDLYLVEVTSFSFDKLAEKLDDRRSKAPFVMFNLSTAFPIA